MSAELAIVDSGGANIGSVRYALQRLGVDTVFTADGDIIANAKRVILPGVGSAAAAMRRLRDNGLDRLLPALRQPVLGICLGMQLLFDSSEESGGADNGGTPCLGIIPGTVRRLPLESGLRIPHMGWNQLHIHKDDALLYELTAPSYAYFVHSYAVPVSRWTLATCLHGESFSAIVRRKNFWAAQFHPERSARVGRQLLRNFLAVPV